MKKFELCLISSFMLGCEILSAQYVWKDVGNPFPATGNVPLGMGVYNGDLYVTGDFGYASGIMVGGITKWNGQSWDSVGKGITGTLTGAWPYGWGFGIYNNNLIVGGGFTQMDSIPNTKCIAKWNGSNWSSVTNNKAFDGGIRALNNYKGDLFIGGDFWNLTGVPKSKCIVRYDGSNFYSVQGGVNGQYPSITSMAIYKGELYVGGTFLYANDTNLIVNNIARWDGISWKTLGSGLDSYVLSMIVDTVKNILYVSGNFSSAGGISVSYIAAWDGNNWSALPAPPFYTSSGKLAIYRDMLFMGSYSPNWNDTAIAYFDGQNWHPVFGPSLGPITALQVYNDELYVAGGFEKIDTMNINYIARLWMPPVGVAEEEKAAGGRRQLKIYPNPTGGSFTVEVQSEKVYTEQSRSVKGKSSKVEIYDTGGRLVYQSVITSPKIEISSKGWSKGSYFVKLISSGKIIASEKIIVE